MPRPMVSEGVATTLTVSPYQYTETIREELERACEPHGLAAVFRDYREQYPEATRRSKAMGMYRQNYCGCVFSKIEAAEEREARKAERAARRLPRKPPRPPRVRPPKLPARRSAPKKQAYANKRARPARGAQGVQASASRRCGLLRERKRGGIAQKRAKRLEAIKEETAKRLRVALNDSERDSGECSSELSEAVATATTSLREKETRRNSPKSARGRLARRVGPKRSEAYFGTRATNEDKSAA